MSFRPVAKLADLRAEKPVLVQTAGKEIALFSIEGKVYAIDNLCCHRGAPLIDGDFTGELVTCPWHAWQFNVRTGACTTVPAARQTSYPVLVDGEDVAVEV